MRMKEIPPIAWLVVALVLVLLAMLPFVLPSFVSGTIPPGWDTVEEKTYHIESSDVLRGAYDEQGIYAGFEDYAVVQSQFPYTTELGDVSFQITGAMQENNGDFIMLKFIKNWPKVDNFTAKAGVYRNKQTWPVKLSDNMRIYVTGIAPPDREGAYYTNTGEFFYGPKSITLKLVEK